MIETRGWLMGGEIWAAGCRRMIRQCRPETGAAVLLALVVLAALAPSAQGAGSFAPCRPGSSHECVELEVPLDRTGAIPGTIEISATRQRAEDELRGTVIYLPGGPGNTGIDALGHAVASLGRAGKDFDVIAFDPRGTGSSEALSCPELQRKARLQRAGRVAARCARRIGPAREAFVTAELVEDVEAIRAAAGAEVVTLLGVSYGTVVAQAYAARHPARVERLILDSSLAPTGFDPFYRASARAIPRILRTLCRGTRCPRGSATKRLRKLASRLAHGPLRGAYFEDGRRRKVVMHAGRLLDLLLAGDFVPSFRARLPRALAAFSNRRNGPLLRLAASLGNDPVPEHELNYAVLASAVCQETVRLPWPRDLDPAGRRKAAAAAAKRIPRRRLAPLNRAIVLRSDWLGLCARWPATSVPGLVPSPLPDVPSLLVSGGTDFRTPVEVSRRIARGLPRATHLVVPRAGHAILGLGRCVGGAVARFLDGSGVGRCRKP